MRFSSVRLGVMKPKVVRLYATSLFPKRSAAMANKKVGDWLSVNEGKVAIYRMRAVTKKLLGGVLTQTNFYIFYKNNP